MRTSLSAAKWNISSEDTHRLDFRRSLVSGLPSPAGSFPEQRLVIEPRILKDDD